MPELIQLQDQTPVSANLLRLILELVHDHKWKLVAKLTLIHRFIYGGTGTWYLESWNAEPAQEAAAEHNSTGGNIGKEHGYAAVFTQPKNLHVVDSRMQ